MYNSTMSIYKFIKQIIRVFTNLKTYPLVNKEHRLKAWVVPKNASSSQKRFFYKLNYREDFQPIFFKKRNIFPVSQIYRSKKFKPANCEDYFKFCVFRDPFERFISFYQDKIIREKFFLNELPLSSRELFTDCSIEITLDNLDYLRKCSKIVRHHTDNQVFFLGNDPSFYDKVFLMDELEELSSVLFKKTGLDLGRINTNKEKVPMEIGTNTIKKIQEVYSKDFEFLEKLS
jgi:hypothetical protein